MGQQKQLLPFNDRTIIEHCINSVIEAGISDVVVVLGTEGKEISKTIRALPVTVAVNDVPESDMAESVRVGLKTVMNDPTGILICLADHPLVRPETVKALLARHQANPASIIIPSFNRRRGHPTLFPKDIIQEIFDRNSLRDVIAAHAGIIFYENTEDAGVVLDMDTPQDYERILRKFSN